ncbi:MAG: metal-sensing transcriptional repressor [Erysipelotrichaceae bacterium]|nr:metal-sensing transcriptional repressor [Erysipelotrichaceae bacterium]
MNNCHFKHEPRNEETVKQLKTRMNRMIGQMNGIQRMLDENRYCGDILIQIAAIEKALEAFGYVILEDHLKTCVVDEVQNGNLNVMDEVVDLMKQLK